ncbi:MAG: hypothetical protein HZB38_05225 [Planctomycetes bacterium]|nr:hypothetical protein [Planctomycetota bacterium]
MVGMVSAKVGLLAFAIAIAAGLHAGNSVPTILTRAMLIMICAILIAQVAAYGAKLILRDHLQNAKSQIDAEHARESEAGTANPPPA